MFPTKEMGGPILCEYGRRVLSGYFLAELGGHWPPRLATLKPQSPYSGMNLRVSDIFHGWW